MRAQDPGKDRRMKTIDIALLSRPLKRFAALGFRAQLVIAFALGMLALAGGIAYATYSFGSARIEARLVEEGQQLTRALARQSVLALLYGSAENARDTLEWLRDTPDVLGVALYLQDGRPLLVDGETEALEPPRPPPGPGAVLLEQGERHWRYLMAVYSEPAEGDFGSAATPQHLGYVALWLSKSGLRRMAAAFLWGNLAIATALAVLLLTALVLITRRLTRPLGELADIMHRARQGDESVRAPLAGPRDIVEMSAAFNAMMDVLAARAQALREARDQALEAARLKGQFAANVTHELRTPLNGILGVLELLDGPELDDRQRHYLRVAQRSAEDLLGLIGDILDFSKFESGKQAPERVDFDLAALLDDVAALLAPRAEAKGIRLDLAVDPAAPAWLRGDAVRLRQVLFNLVGNAIKFTERGRVELRVVPVADAVLRLRFEVRDTGIGIDAANCERIFQPFTQADNSTARRFGGTGLGLAISRQLVESMGGVIGVESRPGQGSCFWFELPFEAGRAPVDAVADAPAPEPVLRDGLAVLVVDDNATNRLVTKGLLEKLGCRVELAESGAQALARFGDRRYDAVLLDIQMPGMDGYRVAAEWRAREGAGRRTPLIAITANNRPEDVERCLAAGMDAVLCKPFKRAELARTLARWYALDAEAAGEASAAGTDSGDVAFDRAVLEALGAEVGAAACAQMIEVYLEDLQLHLQALRHAAERGDGPLLRRTAHTLRGASRHFGAVALAWACEALERESENGGDVGERLGAVERAAAATRPLLEAELRRLQRHAAGAAGTPWGQEATVLVVDDDRSTRIGLRSVLEQDGYRVVECADGEAALAACAERTPDLILLDALLPGLDGFAVCRRLRERADIKHLPILMITALDDEAAIDQAFSSGASDFIPKPLNLAVLRQRIARLLEAGWAEKHIRHLAYHDTLTGLPNRRHFMEALSEALATADDGALTAVLFVDLDRFKLVNDGMGHAAGDLLIQAVAQRLRGALRAGDLIARLGGDEFTVLLTDMPGTEAVARVAVKLGQALARPYELEGQQVWVTASIGIALAPHDARDADTLLRYADTAMFQAKEKRNSFCFYEPTMEARMIRRMQLDAELRSALDRGEFSLHFQPQVSLEEGDVVGVEALVRWIHPQRGMVSPAEFIPVAEETGLIVRLGEWVLNEACRQVAEWNRKGLPRLVLSVNISGRQLEDPDFPYVVLGVLQKTGLPPEQLELEITESAIMKNPEAVIPLLQTLRRHRIGLAVDDFGTGHASLNYLRRFPITTLKIDRSFVNDIGAEDGDPIFVDSIIALAKALRLRLIAEGVETAEQLAFLKSRGCDWVQGFYLYKPMPAERFEERVFCDRKATNF
ncbi:MAG: hypothetical protein KatS3mg121_1368 [Gammaproteobacteria bacterium]|nr:MAG: hypothetical protein KatS3mg121_1368 [Gammaproteobacteria bacterium]